MKGLKMGSKKPPQMRRFFLSRGAYSHTPLQNAYRWLFCLEDDAGISHFEALAVFVDEHGVGI